VPKRIKDYAQKAKPHVDVSISFEFLFFYAWFRFKTNNKVTEDNTGAPLLCGVYTERG
jgi:hypothetical protein